MVKTQPHISGKDQVHSLVPPKSLPACSADRSPSFLGVSLTQFVVSYRVLYLSALQKMLSVFLTQTFSKRVSRAAGRPVDQADLGWTNMVLKNMYSVTA